MIYGHRSSRNLTSTVTGSTGTVTKHTGLRGVGAKRSLSTLHTASPSSKLLGARVQDTSDREQQRRTHHDFQDVVIIRRHCIGYRASPTTSFCRSKRLSASLGIFATGQVQTTIDRGIYTNRRLQELPLSSGKNRRNDSFAYSLIGVHQSLGQHLPPHTKSLKAESTNRP